MHDGDRTTAGAAPAVGAGRSIDGMPAPSDVDAVHAALATVDDPEIRKPITDLGMVKSVDVSPDGPVAVGVYLTVAGCPMRDTITNAGHRRRVGASRASPASRSTSTSCRRRSARSCRPGCAPSPASPSGRSRSPSRAR